ncbi:MAG: type II toxin-antitoxin system Phd/YefM family antitoxin [Glycocaulis sp.]
MMKYVGVLEAKTHLSRLLDELEKTGEPITITRHGKPLADLVPSRQPRKKVPARELVERFRALGGTIRPDPVEDALSWEELKELGRT